MVGDLAQDALSLGCRPDFDSRVAGIPSIMPDQMLDPEVACSDVIRSRICRIRLSMMAANLDIFNEMFAAVGRAR
jgi:hypothetical protein